jgi:hypothetical protein
VLVDLVRISGSVPKLAAAACRWNLR